MATWNFTLLHEDNVTPCSGSTTDPENDLSVGDQFFCTHGQRCRIVKIVIAP